MEETTQSVSGRGGVKGGQKNVPGGGCVSPCASPGRAWCAEEMTQPLTPSCSLPSQSLRHDVIHTGQPLCGHHCCVGLRLHPTPAAHDGAWGWETPGAPSPCSPLPESVPVLYCLAQMSPSPGSLKLSGCTNSPQPPSVTECPEQAWGTLSSLCLVLVCSRREGT